MRRLEDLSDAEFLTRAQNPEHKRHAGVFDPRFAQWACFDCGVWHYPTDLPKHAPTDPFDPTYDERK